MYRSFNFKEESAYLVILCRNLFAHNAWAAHSKFQQVKLTPIVGLILF